MSRGPGRPVLGAYQGVLVPHGVCSSAVERRGVIPIVAGSIPARHPTKYREE